MDGLHICFANIDFSCPNCGEKYSDDDDKFHDRIVKNKLMYTTTICKGCAEKFGIAADMTGDLVSFTLTKK